MTLIVAVNENRSHQNKRYIKGLSRRGSDPCVDGNMTRKLLFLPALALAAAQALAQHALEIIPLRHRTVDQVLPVLRPLLEPGGTLTGQSGQLIVRASPGNLAQIRQALAAMDRPLRRLQVSVRFDDAGGSASRELGASGRISNRGARVEVRGEDRRSASTERVDQSIQVLEGGRAFIMSGQSAAVPGGVWQTGTGFEVVPRISGDRVLLDIAPQKESFDQQHRMATTVSARLGEWFEVGAVASSASRDERGLASGRSASAYDARGVWLKVEELRP